MNVLEVFTGNPFHTPVGQRIDKATDASLPSEDWALNMEICDIINETDEGPKDAVRAIRKKLTNCIGKEWRSVNYCLVVLETCVKNCGKRFHMQIANKDFLQDLVKIIAPKNDPSVTVQEKVLGLIQTWADAFKGSPELRAVETLYQELKQKGIEFPATDMDHMAPIHTPKSSMEPQRLSPVRPASTTHHHHASQPQRTGTTVPSNQPSMMPAGAPTTTAQPQQAPRQPSADQMAKLRSDIDIVQGNCRVFNEMLNVCTPGSSELTTDTTELMKELNRTCRQMQQRIVVLIEQIADEQVTEVLLRVNDDLNNAFLRYDRLERIISLPASKPATLPTSEPPKPTSAVPAGGENAALIDLGPSETSMPPAGSASALTAHMDSLALGAPTNISNVTEVPAKQTADVDDFDAFAQSRKYDNKTPSTAASYSFQAEAAGQTSNSMGAAASGRNNPYAQEESGASHPSASATSSEFDKFLEERAVAGERLPNKPPGEEENGQQRRQLHKDDSENALFAL